MLLLFSNATYKFFKSRKPGRLGEISITGKSLCHIKYHPRRSTDLVYTWNAITLSFDLWSKCPLYSQNFTPRQQCSPSAIFSHGWFHLPNSPFTKYTIYGCKNYQKAAQDLGTAFPLCGSKSGLCVYLEFSFSTKHGLFKWTSWLFEASHIYGVYLVLQRGILYLRSCQRIFKELLNSATMFKVRTIEWKIGTFNINTGKEDWIGMFPP